MSSRIDILVGSVLWERQLPVAVALADPAYGVIGSVIKLNGQNSSDPSELPSRSGTDGVTTYPNIITSATGAFTSVDVGRVITLFGNNAGRYRIASIVSSTEVTVTTTGGGGVQFTSGSSAWSITDTLSYTWKFVSIPVGSKISIEEFRLLDPDGSLVSFSPDVVGEYVVSLTVANNVFQSTQTEVRVSIRALLVPQGRGLVPDGKFIWSYLRDVWQEVQGKELFETFWSALIQICGAELLKLYQTDFNKSISDIQDFYQRRWLKYEPKLSLVEDDITLYIGNHCIGTNAITQNLASYGQAVILSDSELIIVVGTVALDVYGAILNITADVMDSSNIHAYRLQNVNLERNGYVLAPPTTEYPAPDPVPGFIATGLTFHFSFQSTSWSLNIRSAPDYALLFSKFTPPMDELTDIFVGVLGTGTAGDIRVGDVIYYSSGVNSGFYRIVEKSGSNFIVDHAPRDASEEFPGAATADVYRPVEFALNASSSTATSSFAVPYESGDNDASVLAAGRVVTVGDRTFTIVRSFVDHSQLEPLTIIVTDGELIAGQVGLNWRIPHTLISTSQNFEELGVSAGDLLLVGVTNENAQTESVVRAQVVGVDGGRLGFVITDEEVEPGVIPPITSDTYLSLSEDFGISGVTENQDGSLTFSDSAASIIALLNSGAFHRVYWNTPLTPASNINILKGIFRLHPKAIIRNTRVPVDNELVSIPVLQDWIVGPTTIKRDGKTYQVKDGIEYELKTAPVSAIENSDYTIGGDIAFDGEMTFKTGTNLIIVDNGNFVSRGIQSGDEFRILHPVIADPETNEDASPYLIEEVVDDDTVRLSKAVPAYVLGDYVAARVMIHRRFGGNFIRFVPGEFTAKNQAPDRFWGEVSYFDNWPTVENNFGILVGLKQDQLESISSTINYRQAVAGLMFAYTKGPIINKVKLGAQILVGLPFAEHAGIIRSLENDYRLNDAGDAVLGRFLIEDTDPTGTPLGTMRVYTFPIDPISELAGVETNPATGVPYVVGDSVELFAPLSKGIEVDDYISNPQANQSLERILQQYNTVRIRANDDIFSIDELGLLSDFLRKITPAGVALIIATTSEFMDEAGATDDLTMSLNDRWYPFVDNPSGLGSPLMFNPKLPLFSSDDGFFWKRKHGFDLETVYDGSSTLASVPGGGLVNPSYGEAPVTKVGDYLKVIDGPNQGLYPITAVTDGTLTVSGLPASGFQTATQEYVVVRKLEGLIRDGNGTFESGEEVISLEAGLTADGVMPGDVLTVDYAGGPKRHDILRVGPADAGSVEINGVVITFPALLAGQVQVSPDAYETDTLDYRIYRPVLMESPYAGIGFLAALASDGASYTSFSDNLLWPMIEPGDELEVYNLPTKVHLVVFDAVNLGIVPVLPVGLYFVKLCKRGNVPAPLNWDSLAKFFPTDKPSISLSETTTQAAQCTSGVATVVLQVSDGGGPFGPFNPRTGGVLRGDFLILTEGGNSSVDVGYGSGVYPIVDVADANVTLALPLTSGDDSAWKVLRRR